MPFALVVIGLIMIITGAQNTHKAFGAQVVKDFQNGPNCNPMQGQFQNCGFIWWVSSLVAIGALGYIKPLEAFSRWFMALIIISIILANQGFFGKLQQGISAQPTTPQRDTSVNSMYSGGEGSSSSGPDIASVARTALNILPFFL
jgi:hypothetical protein